MDTIERLSALFEKFPGIGPRQAGRFVQFLLRNSSATRRELAELIQELGKAVSQCETCMRYHGGKGTTCSICASKGRDAGFLMIVANDADLAALEKSKTYNGLYFVLGGTLALGAEKTNGLRTKQLLASLPERKRGGLKEIILAFPANPEGDATGDYVREKLIITANDGHDGHDVSIIITTLGRGLSTGSELEYADAETIKSALESRR